MNRRYEDKYLLNSQETHQFVFHNSQYLIKDFEALQFNQSHNYIVNSLYYDTYCFRSFNQKVNGDQFKFKLRVRDYGRKDKYLELKLKEGTLGYKYRVLIKSSLSESYEYLLSNLLIDEIKKFQIPLSLSSFRPVLRVSYMREAYRLMNNRAVKVNLDSKICYEKFGVTFNNETLSSKVLEIKYNKKNTDDILSFARVKTEFSKYQRGIENVYSIK